MKTSYIVIGVIVLLIGGFIWYSQMSSAPADATQQPAAQTPDQTGTQQATQTPDQGTTPTPAPTTSTQHTAAITNYAFDPGTITVKKGDTITWTNNDSVPHTVTSDTGAFASDNLAKGQSYSYTFTTAGTFPYHCAVHPSMHGTVVVQ